MKARGDFKFIIARFNKPTIMSSVAVTFFGELIYSRLPPSYATVFERETYDFILFGGAEKICNRRIFLQDSALDFVYILMYFE